MRNIRTKGGFNDWTRLALKLAVLLTDPKVRSAISDEVKDRVGDVADTVSKKYGDVRDAVASRHDDAVGRLESVTQAFEGRSPWRNRTAGFLLGIGVGAGLGILLAPASGSQTRQTLRDKAVDIKTSIFEATAPATAKPRPTVRDMPFTGTES